MSNSADMIMPMLREMRAENVRLHEVNAGRLGAMDACLNKLEEASKNFRNALSADTLLSRLVTGDFEERIQELERHAAVSEGSKA